MNSVLFRSTNSIRYMLNSIRPSLWLQIENSKWPPSLVRSLSYYVVLWGNVFLRNWLINECVQCIFGWKNELLSHTRVCHMLFKHSEIAFLRNSLVCPMHVMIEEITTRVCPMLCYEWRNNHKSVSHAVLSILKLLSWAIH